MKTLTISELTMVAGSGAPEFLLGCSAAHGLYIGCKAGINQLEAVHSFYDFGQNLYGFGSSVTVGVVGLTLLATIATAMYEDAMRPYHDPNHVFVKEVRD